MKVLFLLDKPVPSSPVFMLDEKLLSIADTLVQNSTEKRFNKDAYLLDQVAATQETIDTEEETVKANPDYEARLKEFRLIRSRELECKPFYIFTNKTLEAILEREPKTMEELLSVQGIGPKKAREFGEDILAILNS